MDESHRHYVEQKEARHKVRTMCRFISMMVRNVKLIYDNRNHNKSCFWMMGVTRKGHREISEIEIFNILFGM